MPAMRDKAFEIADAGFSKVAPLPLTLKPSVEKLADGVYVIHNVAGSESEHDGGRVQGLHRLRSKRPARSDGADNVIKRIKETIPGKPIRYVAVTHHHGDHIGGLRSFIAEGATVITTQRQSRSR